MTKIVEVIEDINANLLERTEVVRGIFQALLSKRHVFLLGPPGTAKSLSVEAVQSRITGSNRFKLLMTKFTDTNEVCGPLDIVQFQQGVYHRKTEGYLPTAHIAFLDEVFKANSAILNSLLTMLNEREYTNGAQRVTVPLMTCVGASNELPQGGELGALYDRFLLRFFVPYIAETSNFARMLTMTAPANPVSMTLAEVEQAQREVSAVKVDEEVVQAILDLRSNLDTTHGITASDRRWRESINVLRAEAFLEGRSEVKTEDITALANVLWQDPAEQTKVAQAVIQFAVPELAAAHEKLDLAIDQRKAALDPKATATTQAEAAKKFRMIKNEFDALLRGKTVTGRLATIRQKMTTIQREIGEAVLGR